VISRTHRAAAAIHRAHAGSNPALDLFGGLETRTLRDAYRWDGLRRGADPHAPFLVFQHTLSGAGIVETGGRSHEVGEHHAFLAVVPSAHRYTVAADPGRWTFFWVIIRHPYVVRRLADRLATPAAVFRSAGRHPLTRSSLALFRRAAAAAGSDPYRPELALFEWMLALERVLAARGAAPGEAERWLEEVRACVLEHPDRPPDVSELARRRAMGRSPYTRAFHHLTGRTPAAWVTEIRLGEVVRRLRTTGDKLDRIARETGFADANHLCKAFRRRTGLSPGAFRKQGL